MARRKKEASGTASIPSVLSFKRKRRNDPLISFFRRRTLADRRNIVMRVMRGARDLGLKFAKKCLYSKWLIVSFPVFMFLMLCSGAGEQGRADG
jgi:hypothetical protein